MRVNTDVDVVAAKIAELLRVPPARVRPDTELVELVTDSFLMVEIVIDLQEEFGVRFEQRDVQLVRTVGDLAELVQLRAAA